MTTVAIDARKIADFGIGTYVRGLVGALARLDHAVRYLLLAGPDGPAALPHLPGNFRWLEERSPGYSLRELVSVARSLRRERVDLFHAPHYVVPFALPCPFVVTVHDLIHLRFPEHRSRLELAYARTMIGRAVRRAERVIAVSRSTAEELSASFPAAAGKLEVIPNGVDEVFRHPPSDAETRSALAGAGLEPGYLLFVGNPKPHKNLERLLAAYRRLLDRRPAAPPLVLVGEREGVRSPVASWIARAGLEGRVRRLGHQPAGQLPALYRGASMLLQPSLWEGFGMPVAEAMAAGTPVVAGARGALPEVAGDAALLVDPEDTEALCRAISQLLDDPARRAELGDRGRARAGAFHWDDCARRTLEVYRRALGSGYGGTG
jgi:glycosyltransferase involved in cell wall biosynthesis